MKSRNVILFTLAVVMMASVFFSFHQPEASTSRGVTPAMRFTPGNVMTSSNGIEDFSSYGEGNNVTGGYWNAWSAAGKFTFNQTTATGRLRKYVASAPTSYPYYTFGTAQPSTASGTVGITLRVATYPNGNWYLGFDNVVSTWSAVCGFLLASNGQLFARDSTSGSWLLTGTLSLNTNYGIRCTMVDAHLYDVWINSTQYTNSGNHFHKTDLNPIVMFQMSPPWGGNDGLMIDIKFDNLWTSWTSAGPSTDSTAPASSCSFTPVYTSGAKKWVSAATTFTLSATDGQSGVASTSFRVHDNTTSTETRAWQTYSTAFTLNSATNGTYTIVYNSLDNAANNESLQYSTTYIDANAPSPSAVSYSAIYNASVTKGFILPAATITLGATDGTGESGVAALGYKWLGITGTSGTKAWGTYTVPFSISSNGTYQVIYSYWDNVGNNATSSFIIRVDTIAPTTTISFTPAYTSDGKSWVSSSTSFTLTTTDNAGGCGVASQWYTIKELWGWIGTLPYSSPFAPGGLSNGTWTLQAWGIDNLGNNETSAASQTVNLDAISPVLGDPVYSTIYNGSVTKGYILPAATIALAGTDGAGQSGVAGTGYKINGIAGTSYHRAWGAYAVPFSISSNGTYRVTWSCWDNVGNNATSSFIIRVDSLPATTTISYTPAYTSGGKGWITSSTTFTVSATDNTGGCGVASTWYTIMELWWWIGTIPYSSPFSSGGLSNGTWTLQAWGIDNLGNNETSAASRIVNLDTLAPVLSDPAYSAIYNASTTKGFILPATTITVPTTDGTGQSGVAGTGYKIDGIAGTSYHRAWGTYTAPFSISGNGTYQVTWSCWDHVGNNASASFIIRVDAFSPSTNISFTPVFTSHGKNWVTSSTVFSLVAGDGAGESGIGETWFKWNGSGTNAWVQYTTSFMLSTMGNGTYTIAWCTWDNAGNNETLNTTIVYIDTIDPVVVATTSITGVYVQITIVAMDNAGGAGIATLIYRINGSSWTSYTSPLFLLDNVSWFIEYVSIDNVGNWGTIESITTSIVPTIATVVNWRLVVVVLAVGVLAIFGLVAATRKYKVVDQVQVQVHVQRKRAARQMLQTAGIGVATGIFTGLVYLLWISPASEPIINVVKIGINTQTLSGIDAAQSLLSTFTLVVIAVFVFVAGLVMHSKKGLASAVFSLLTTWLVMLAVSFVGLMLFAHWQFQITYMFAMPVLFTCYVLANSGYYIAIFIVVLTIVLFRFNKQFGVQQ